jgi:hypothetical protein
MECPRCKLTCPEETLYCDCGHRFLETVPPSLRMQPVPRTFTSRFVRRFLRIEMLLAVIPCSIYALLVAFLAWVEGTGPLPESWGSFLELTMYVGMMMLYAFGLLYFLLPGMLLGETAVKGGYFLLMAPNGVQGLLVVFSFYTVVSVFVATICSQERVRIPRGKRRR